MQDTNGYIFENDRLNKYFSKYLKSFLFVEFSDEFMQKLDITDIAKGVKVPIDPHDLKKFAGGEGVSTTQIAENMVWVVGCDPNFKYAEAYKQFMKLFFNEKLSEDIFMRGVAAVQENDLENACIHFRATLFLEPNMMTAMYNYARVCREIYLSADDEEIIGSFKAEAFTIFEELTIQYPDFDEPYFFLGYAYLNMGLYEKAGLTWEKYLPIAKNPQALQEIAKRLREIDMPRKIESGCNAIISGKYQEGLNILLTFVGSDYDTWWPLHFYIATAYEELGNDVLAEDEYKKTLRLNAASIDSMDGLIRIYNKRGDEENINKYKRKKELVCQNYKQ